MRFVLPYGGGVWTAGCALNMVYMYWVVCPSGYLDTSVVRYYLLRTLNAVFSTSAWRRNVTVGNAFIRYLCPVPGCSSMSAGTIFCGSVIRPLFSLKKEVATLCSDLVQFLRFRYLASFLNKRGGDFAYR